MKKILCIAMMLLSFLITKNLYAIGVTNVQLDPNKQHVRVHGDDAEINVDASGDVQIDILSSALPTGAATEATLARIDSNIVLCNTGDVEQADPNSLLIRSQPPNKTPYAIEYAVGTSSVNFAFGFTSRAVYIWADSANTDDLAVDLLGGTAVVPSADTAGDARFPAGAILSIPWGTSSISAIAASGSQTIRIIAIR